MSAVSPVPCKLCQCLFYSEGRYSSSKHPTGVFSRFKTFESSLVSPNTGVLEAMHRRESLGPVHVCATGISGQIRCADSSRLLESFSSRPPTPAHLVSALRTMRQVVLRQAILPTAYRRHVPSTLRVSVLLFAIWNECGPLGPRGQPSISGAVGVRCVRGHVHDEGFVQEAREGALGPQCKA